MINIEYMYSPIKFEVLKKFEFSEKFIIIKEWIPWVQENNQGDKKRK